MTLSIQNRVEVMVAGSWEEGLVWGEAPGRARQVAVGEKKKKRGGEHSHPKHTLSVVELKGTATTRR
jgi:quercetin dioxygenase-like cupin family protein